MFGTHTGRVRVGRTTQRNLRSPFGSENHCGASSKSGILLADNKERCPSIHGNVPRMPKIRARIQYVARRVTPDRHALAFQSLGVDILGPFPLAKGQVKFLIVAVDYFTKWIEAKPIATITTRQVQNFLWKHIICRHGLPHSVVTDNGRQFTDRTIKQFLDQLGGRHIETSV